MASRDDSRYADYLKTVMRHVESGFGIAMFEERHDDVDSAERELAKLYALRIPPRLAAEALVTGAMPSPTPVHITPGSPEWSALISVCELARARVAHIEQELDAAGATEGRVVDIVQELASHVAVIDGIINHGGVL